MRSIRYASRMRRTLALSVFLAAVHSAGAGAFSFEDVAERAQLQARQPYRSSNRKAPAQLQALTYDQYRDIRFRPDRALWRSDKLPFELMFFHLGKFQKEAVRIEEVTPPIGPATSTSARTSCHRRAGAISVTAASARITR